MKPFRLDLKPKKKVKEQQSQQSESTNSFFDGGEREKGDEIKRETVREYDGTKAIHEATCGTKQPLVIPVVQNSGRVFALGGQAKATKKDPVPIDAVSSSSVDLAGDDAEAIRALQQEAKNPEGHVTKSGSERPDRNISIEAPEDSFHQSKEEERETQQFHRDMAALPDAMNVEEYRQSQVSIGEFGAAMLRGMGWTGDDNDKQNKNTNNSQQSLPRPHRLGLGAIPKLERADIEETEGRRPKTMDQYERDKKLRKQAQDFARQRQKQVEIDKQQTLQNGSLVLLDNGRRAKIVQLDGVPGLNQVLIRVEGEGDVVSAKRGIVGRLLKRDELQERPFTERTVKDSSRESDRKNSKDSTHRDISRDNGRREREYSDSSRRKRRRDEVRESSDRSARKTQHRNGDFREGKQRTEPNEHSRYGKKMATWVIPQIRVRVVTEKLGRRYFKEKGTVIDVTPKGSTVQLDEGRVVLDRVPERYLETALPKAGGRVVVVGPTDRPPEYIHCKGTLLERGKGRGVLQIDSDKSVLTLSLDDLAEWVGAMDDE